MALTSEWCEHQLTSGKANKELSRLHQEDCAVLYHLRLRIATPTRQTQGKKNYDHLLITQCESHDFFIHQNFIIGFVLVFEYLE